MPLRLRDLFKLTENIENLIQWLFQLGLVLELSGVSCKFCDKGRFGLERTRHSVLTSVAGVVLTKHVVRRCQLDRDPGS